MWLPWTDEEAERVLALLRNAGEPTLADALDAELQWRKTEDAERLGKVVRDQYSQLSDGDLDVDDKVAISESDKGAYILVWLWLTNTEMGGRPKMKRPRRKRKKR